jgi:hypothetical protein
LRVSAQHLLAALSASDILAPVVSKPFRFERAFILDRSIFTINRYNTIERNEQLCNLGSAG